MLQILDIYIVMYDEEVNISREEIMSVTEDSFGSVTREILPSDYAPTKQQLKDHPALKNAWNEYLIVHKLITPTKAKDEYWKDLLGTQPMYSSSGAIFNIRTSDHVLTGAEERYEILLFICCALLTSLVQSHLFLILS